MARKGARFGTLTRCESRFFFFWREISDSTGAEIPLLLLGEKNESSLRPLKQKACKSDEEAGTEVACFLAAFGFAERIKPKAVVFDLGGVVVCGDQRILCDRLFPDRPPEQRPYWMADVYKTDMWARLDAGRLVRNIAFVFAALF